MSIKDSRFITNILLNLKNIGPFHIGDNDGDILIDSITGLPYVPATGIAGAFKAYIADIDKDKAMKLFGSSGENGEGNNSKVFIYDTYGDSLKVETRPGVEIDSKLGVAKDEGKFERTFIGEGTEFDLRIEIFSKDENDKKDNKEIIYKCINALNSGHIRFGGFKGYGAGEFEVLSAKECEYDLFNKTSLLDYIERNEKYKDITSKIKNKDIEDRFVDFDMECKTLMPVLVKGISTNDSNEADSINIKDVNGDYIIPGSSLKGVMRCQSKRISTYKGINDELLKYVFGNDKDSEEKIMGRLYVSDSKITESEFSRNYVHHRIRIDKYLGGTFTGNKFDENPVDGSFKISIKYKLNDEKTDKAAVGMLLLIFRDIATSSLTIGGGNNIGRGRIEGKKLKMKWGQKSVVIDFDKKKISDDKYVQSLVNEFIAYGRS